MRVLLVGDTHCSTSVLQPIFETAEELNCDRIFQLGDFGFWPKNKLGRFFLERVDRRVQTHGIPFYFLAGNHEDWNDLDIVFATYRTDDDGFYKYEHLKLAPRSHVWDWDGLHFANMSGAYSIDAQWRTPMLDWFPQELPSEHDVDNLVDLMRLKELSYVDVMLAHDAPLNLYAHQGQVQKVINVIDAKYSQHLHSMALDKLQPSCYIHGHWHMAYAYYYDRTFCFGLDQMTTTKYTINIALLDTSERTLATITATENVIFELP